MLSIRKELRQGLTNATGLDVYFVQPPINTNVAIPLLILEETANSQYYRDRNSRTEIVSLSYDISIYTDNQSQMSDLMASVDDYMFNVGLKRTYTSTDMSIDINLDSNPLHRRNGVDSKLYCKTITYVCKATKLESGNIQISQ